MDTVVVMVTVMLLLLAIMLHGAQGTRFISYTFSSEFFLKI